MNWAYEYDVKISNIKGTLIDTIWKSIKKYDFSSDNSDGSRSDDSDDSDVQVLPKGKQAPAKVA